MNTEPRYNRIPRTIPPRPNTVFPEAEVRVINPVPQVRYQQAVQPVLDTAEVNTCPYSWMFGLGACIASLCTLIIVIVFAIWIATKGVSNITVN